MLCNMLRCRMESGDTKLHGMSFIFVACLPLDFAAWVQSVPAFGQSSQLGSLHPEAGAMLKLPAGASQSRTEVALP